MNRAKSYFIYQKKFSIVKNAVQNLRKQEFPGSAFVLIYPNHTKSLRHQEFPGGPPSKYYPGPTMLNFRDRTRTGAFIVVWP